MDAAERFASTHGDFEHPEGYREAFELWLNAYHRSEIFDQHVCEMRNERGHAIPLNRTERRLTTQHARQVYEAADRRIASKGIAPDVSRRAREAALEHHERRRY